MGSIAAFGCRCDPMIALFRCSRCGGSEQLRLLVRRNSSGFTCTRGAPSDNFNKVAGYPSLGKEPAQAAGMLFGNNARMARLRYQLLGFLGALAVFALTGEDVARGSCGDYLTHGVANSSVKKPRPIDQPAWPPEACHGPNCSRRESPPQVPVAPAPTLRDWPAAMTAPVEPPAIVYHESGHERSSAFSSQSPSDIFHPPR